MENTLNKNFLTLVIGLVLIGTTSIGCITYYSLNKMQAMKSNIESAIVKGIDPVAVRCAYKADSTMCAIYATKSK